MIYEHHYLQNSDHALLSCYFPCPLSKLSSLNQLFETLYLAHFTRNKTRPCNVYQAFYHSWSTTVFVHFNCIGWSQSYMCTLMLCYNLIPIFSFCPVCAAMNFVRCDRKQEILLQTKICHDGANDYKVNIMTTLDYQCIHNLILKYLFLHDSLKRISWQHRWNVYYTMATHQYY